MMDVVKSALAENEIEVDLRFNGTYISAIKGLGEFDGGSGSGWVGTLNGFFPSMGFGATYVEDKDTIRVMYTVDIGDVEGEW